MKYKLVISILVVTCNNLFSQTSVTLKGEQETIYPFETESERLYFDWLKNGKDFENIEVFAMGEATHGTKDFFDIKVRSFQYLVKNENFKIFGIEASYGECNYINDYIQSGIGNIDSIMNYINFWTWRTEEVKELVIWMKEYNQRHTEKLKFYGFDMQDSFIPLKYLADIFCNDTNTYVAAFNEIVKPIIQKNDYEIGLLIKKEGQKFKDTLKAISKQLYQWSEKYKNDIITKYSLNKFRQLHFNLLTFEQAINRYNKQFNYRDSCMAVNVIEIQRMENEKIFLWAHNGHVNKSLPYAKSLKPMGEHLHESFKMKYYSVGFVFSEGSFWALERVNKTKIELKVVTLPVYSKNTFTKAFDETGLRQFFIDLQASNNSLFEKKLRAYSLGSMFRNKKKCSILIIAQKQFDGIIYTKVTSSAIPLK